MSLPYPHRLTGKRAFREIFERPIVVSDPCFKILARYNSEACSRLGLAVSRKVDGRAVQRNRLKRLIRESFRQFLAGREQDSNADYLVLPRPAAVTISNQEVFERLAKLWNNVGRKLSHIAAQGPEANAGSAPKPSPEIRAT
jgi:ribonuclease P protein component